MSLSHDLQNLIADVSAAIATNQPLGRADLEIMRRNLNAAAREAGRIERGEASSGMALATLCDGLDRGVADIAGLARHARTLVPAVVA